MPIAAPTMPSSLIGASKQRSFPKRSCRPCVHRNTPPKYPTSSPKTTTRSSRSIATACASRIASIIDIDGTSVTHLRALVAKVARQVVVHVVEHRARVGDHTALDRAVRIGRGECLLHLGVDVA